MSVRERPILFSGPMVRALFAGTKTQTRRVVKPQPAYTSCQQPASAGVEAVAEAGIRLLLASKPSPYGVTGDRLWVREAWSTRLDRDHLKPSELDPKYDGPFFWADPETCNTGCGGAAGRKRASFHLPRWASRLTLEITDVRVHRLQEISEEDALAEGGVQREALPPDADNFHPPGSYGFISGLHPFPKGRIYPTAGEAFGERWDSINLARDYRAEHDPSWKANPWVWAITFRPVE